MQHNVDYMQAANILPVRPPIPIGIGRGAIARDISLSRLFSFSVSGGLLRAVFSSSIIVSSIGGCVSFYLLAG